MQFESYQLGSLLGKQSVDDIVDAIRQVAGKNVGAVRFDQKIAELGMDSVSVMEMVGTLEERLGVTFADDELTKQKRDLK